MLSISECRKHLSVEKFTDEEVEGIKTELNQIVTVLVTEYLTKRTLGENK